MRRSVFALPLFIASMCAVLLAAHTAHAVETTLPVSALVPSTNYYTDTIGGGIGDVVVMTGGAMPMAPVTLPVATTMGLAAPRTWGSRSIFLARTRPSTG